MSYPARKLTASAPGVDTIACNPIQFQHGTLLPEFLRAFRTEFACSEVVMRARGPDGFRCPRCDTSAHCVTFSQGRLLFQCHLCNWQTSLTAGTLFGGINFLLTTWPLAIYLISQAKTGLPTLQLKRQLRVSYPTAWLMQHKVMAAQDAQHRLFGTAQVNRLSRWRA